MPGPSWNQSISKALGGSTRAIEGRFTVALASFEQIDPDGARLRERDGRTLLDFAEDLGMVYHTLAKYRSIAYWWFESDLGLVDEIGMPTNLDWEVLRWAKASQVLSADLRARTRDVPPNGRRWSVDDVMRLYQGELDAPAANPYDPVVGVRRATSQLTRSLLALRREGIDASVRESLRHDAQQARAAADFLLSTLDGNGDDAAVAEWLQAQTTTL